MSKYINSHWTTVKDFVFIALGLLLYTIGFTGFILPEKVVVGGIAGVCTIIYFATEQFFGWGFPIPVTNITLNLILLSFAFRICGKQFTFRTIYGTVVLSLLIAVFQHIFSSTPIVKDQTFMNVLIGSLLCGSGLGLAFTHNGSTGGSDIIAAIVAKKSRVSIGRTIMLCDFAVISSSYFLFHSVDKIVFGVVFLLVLTNITDLIINSNRKAVQFLIFSSKWREIADVVTHETGRGCTVVDGTGWYTQQEVHLLIIVVRNIESLQIFRIIKSIDPHAFISQGAVNGVYGNGFDEMKIK